jgi:hypothetical protein
MNECLVPALEAPAAWRSDNARRAESEGDLPTALPREALSLWDYVRFAVEQQGVYCQLV